MLWALILYMSKMRKCSWQFYMLSEFLPEIYREEVDEEIFVHIFILMSDLGFESGPYV